MNQGTGRRDGSADVAAAIAEIEGRLPRALAPLARLAYNYWWSWAPGGDAAFCAIDAACWHGCRSNPVRFLADVSARALARAAEDPAIVALVAELGAGLAGELARAPEDGGVGGPVAFFCAEFGVHRSLPIYSGGLGVLAGDLLKEASDQAFPMIGVGLLYRSGFFHQRIDTSGWQHEYWIETDPERAPTVRVTGADGKPLAVTVPVGPRSVVLHAWRVDVGRVPLYLLDAESPHNAAIDRWITARLYEGNRAIRLGQYAALGIGGVRLLAAMGIEPARVHLNEGHAALAAIELAAREVAAGRPFAAARARARARVVFTTHTPVPAGNETYTAGEALGVLAQVPELVGLDPQEFLDLGRQEPGAVHEPAGMTALAIRMAGRVNGVSLRHGEVARAMWRRLASEPGGVRLDHVTNGVHAPTWTAPSFRRLYDRHLGRDWPRRAADPETWRGLDEVPDRELWAARCEARHALIEFVRGRSVTDRLRRGEPLEYVEAAANALRDDRLTVGFARRLASYKRLRLLVHDPRRALALLDGESPLQLVFAGKAHPQDEEAKKIVQHIFALKSSPQVAGRAVFVEDYNMAIAAAMVGGCDVWINLPIPPLEACGTSGMKSALSGGLQLSVLDGWWAEAYEPGIGWAIESDPEVDDRTRDARDAAALYDLLEREVVPLFASRDAEGVPRGFVARMRASIQALAPRFCAARMFGEYVGRVYRG